MGHFAADEYFGSADLGGDMADAQAGCDDTRRSPVVARQHMARPPRRLHISSSTIPHPGPFRCLYCPNACTAGKQPGPL